MSRKPLIVGIDPGNTSAVAAVNFDGDLELLKSKKEYGRAEIIQNIVETGKPVVVASDRSDTPSTVRKIGQSLGAERFKPDSDLDTETKKELGEGENSHEQDASAAAFFAYNQLRKSIRKIKSYSERKDKDLASVASNYFSPNALKSEEYEETSLEIERNNKNRFDTESDRLRSKLGEVRKSNENLRQQVSDLREGILNEEIESQRVEQLEKKLEQKKSKIQDFEEKVEKLENQKINYIEALKKVKKGYEPILKVNERSTVFHDKVVAENSELKQKLLKKGYNAKTIDEVEGLELENFVIVEDFPQIDNISEIIKDKNSDES